MKRLSLLLVILLLTGSIAAAQSSTDTMALANQLYQGGQRADAAQLYQQLVDSGLQNSDLDYNLGNAYFKMGQLGRAIYYYQQAQTLNPRDPDIAANLDLARGQAVDKYEGGSGNVAVDLANASRTLATTGEFGAAALALWFIFAVLWIARRHLAADRARRITQGAWVAVTVLLVISGVLFGSRVVAERSQVEGVVVTDQVDVTSAPVNDAITEFTLHDGAQVAVLEQRDGWVRLALPGEHLQGWVPLDTILVSDTV